MSRSEQLIRMVGLPCAALLLAGCTYSVGNAAAPRPVTPRPVTADVRACAGVEGILGHLKVDTGRWSPTLNPFDKAIAGRIRLHARDLDRQATLTGNPRIRRAVHTNAAALTAMADAMTSKKQAKVTSALAGTRTSYRTLKSVCSFG